MDCSFWPIGPAVVTRSIINWFANFGTPKQPHGFSVKLMGPDVPDNARPGFGDYRSIAIFLHKI